MGFIIKAGKLNTRIELQSKSTTYDALGQPVLAWATDYTVSASVKPLSSREAYFAKAVRPETTHRVLIRFLSGFSHHHRIKIGARILNILAILNIDDDNKTMQVDCLEVVT